jgi:hypothetical protein
MADDPGQLVYFFTSTDTLSTDFTSTNITSTVFTSTDIWSTPTFRLQTFGLHRHLVYTDIWSTPTFRLHLHFVYIDVNSNIYNFSDTNSQLLQKHCCTHHSTVVAVALEINNGFSEDTIF